MAMVFLSGVFSNKWMIKHRKVCCFVSFVKSQYTVIYYNIEFVECELQQQSNHCLRFSVIVTFIICLHPWIVCTLLIHCKYAFDSCVLVKSIWSALFYKYVLYFIYWLYVCGTIVHHFSVYILVLNLKV